MVHVVPGVVVGLARHGVFDIKLCGARGSTREYPSLKIVRCRGAVGSGNGLSRGPGVSYSPNYFDNFCVGYVLNLNVH